MTKPLRDQEFRAVMALPGQKRYIHSIKQMADWEEVWSLRNKRDWVMAADDSGHEIIPIWPHPRYAEACAVREWAGTQPSLIEVHEFVDRWVPGMIRDSRLVSVFPTPSAGRGVVVTPERLRQVLNAELERMG